MSPDECSQVLFGLSADGILAKLRLRARRDPLSGAQQVTMVTAAAGLCWLPLHEKACDGARLHAAHGIEFAALLALEQLAGGAENIEDRNHQPPPSIPAPRFLFCQFRNAP